MLQSLSSRPSSSTRRSRPRSSKPSGSAPSGSATATPNLVGRRVGHVRLEALLDRGGMGEVYRGFDEALERPVAVKVVRAEDRLAAKARDRFWREARLLSKLDHPNICRVYDLITDDAVDGAPLDLLVLEFVQGAKLGERLRRGIRPADKLRIAREIAGALDAAHRLRIVHRDLKPSNVMIRPSGQVKVLDFGLARSLDSASALTPSPVDSQRIILDDDGYPVETVPADGDQSSHGILVGTLEFMSPEQALGETVTEASDLYAFGLLLQWLFTERSPYGDDQKRYDLMRRVLAGDTEPIVASDRQGAESRLDPELLLLIEALKRPNPEHRPTATECADRLARLAGKPARRRARRTAWLAALVASVLIVVGIAWNRQQSIDRTELAMSFAQDAKDIEWAMRLGYSIPLHPLAPHEREVQRRMNTVAGRLQTSGGFARGPAELALGRGHLELGELTAARRRLERAWERGYRRPEVALALGDVLTRLHREAHDESLLDPSPVWAADRRRWADATLGARALDRLRAARGPGLGTGVLTEALVALQERRYDAARQLAHRVTLAVPWLYEAHLVDGAAAAALGEWSLAEEAYAQAAEVAPSDPRVHEARCRWGSLQAASGALSEADRRAAEDACDRVLIADPDRLRSELVRARMQALVGELDLAIETADRVLAERPEATVAAAAHRVLANLYRLRASTRDDPRDDLARAMEHGRQAARLDASDPGGHAAAGRAALDLAHHLAGDPTGDAPARLDDTLDEVLGAAIVDLQGYRLMRPELVPVYAELARAYLLRHAVQIALGGRTTDTLTAARRALARARRMAPDDPDIAELLERLAAAELDDSAT